MVTSGLLAACGPESRVIKPESSVSIDITSPDMAAIHICSSARFIDLLQNKICKRLYWIYSNSLSAAGNMNLSNLHRIRYFTATCLLINN